MVPRGEAGTRDRREETVTGTGTEVETGTRTRTRTGTRTGMRAGAGVGTGTIIERQGGGEREPGNLRSDSRVRSEDAREGATSTSNHQSQLQDPTPERDRRVMRRTNAQGREARDGVGEGGGGAKKRKKPQKNCRHDVENGKDSGGRGTKVDNDRVVLVQ